MRKGCVPPTNQRLLTRYLRPTFALPRCSLQSTARAMVSDENNEHTELTDTRDLRLRQSWSSQVCPFMTDSTSCLLPYKLPAFAINSK